MKIKNILLIPYQHWFINFANNVKTWIPIKRKIIIVIFLDITHFSFNFFKSIKSSKNGQTNHIISSKNGQTNHIIGSKNGQISEISVIKTDKM